MIQSAKDWISECCFIADATNHKGKLKAFNFDTQCFIRYCELQRDDAERQKFFDAAQYIQHCIDDLKG